MLRSTGHVARVAPTKRNQDSRPYVVLAPCSPIAGRGACFPARAVAVVSGWSRRCLGRVGGARPAAPVTPASGGVASVSGSRSDTPEPRPQQRRDRQRRGRLLAEASECPALSCVSALMRSFRRPFRCVRDRQSRCPVQVRTCCRWSSTAAARLAPLLMAETATPRRSHSPSRPDETGERFAGEGDREGPASPGVAAVSPPPTCASASLSSGRCRSPPRPMGVTCIATAPANSWRDR